MSHGKVGGRVLVKSKAVEKDNEVHIYDMGFKNGKEQTLKEVIKKIDELNRKPGYVLTKALKQALERLK